MNYKSLPDEMLLLYLRTGDQQAFREIYQRYRKKLYTIARHKFQSLDVIEELVQDIFLKVLGASRLTTGREIGCLSGHSCSVCDHQSY